MKEILLKSLKQHTITIGVLATVCVGLLGLNFMQNNQYHKMLKQQTDKYTELMIIQQPDIQEFPNRKLGKFTLSWYSPKELGKTKPSELRTSTGIIPKEGRTIAVDPKVIPYGSIVYIQDYGYFMAEDCGGAIKNNRIDIFTASHEYALQQGKKVANVWVLGKI
jgi:3D (Asp-Asp-Asp) domain-containing protein